MNLLQVIEQQNHGFSHTFTVNYAAFAPATVKPSMDFDHLSDTALNDITIIVQLPRIDICC